MAFQEDITDILDPEILDLLGTVTACTCALVDPEESCNPPTRWTADVDLSRADTELLLSLLRDARSWWLAAKRCLPKRTAILCLHSRVQADIKLHVGMSCFDWTLAVDGKDDVWGFFDPVSAEVRGILKRTFPELASAHSTSMWKAGAIASLKRDLQ